MKDIMYILGSKYLKEKVLLFSICLISALLTCCQSKEDISSIFKNQLQAEWVLTKDCFIVDFEEDVPSILEVGHSDDLPDTIQDYINSPKEWQKKEKYIERFKSPGCKPRKVIAAIESGTHFKILQVIRKKNFEVGTRYLVVVKIDKVKEHSGISYASFIFNVDIKNKLLLSSSAVEYRVGE